ncbi:hypothetical protein [Halomarina oriensis]|uniref:Uncharacterized protein n=1 Tax=Halomarina oriensis TaxID=671145 RepID=A0A6B0GSU5_9EURY|nr:hypothetical protein [Halomarina oriensis]MWG34738.1 hypothetical protein [Halomarina oriensis]
MSGATETLLRGERGTREWYVSGVYALSLLLVVSLVVLPGGALSDALYGRVLPVVLFATPPLVAGVSAVRGGGLLEGIVIGVVPSVAFVLFGRPEALAVDTAGTVAVLCLGGALLGFLAGYACRELVHLFRAH